MNLRRYALLLLLAPLACSSESKCEETFSCGEQQVAANSGRGNRVDSGGDRQDSGKIDSGTGGTQSGNSGGLGGDNASGGTAGVSGGGETDADGPCAACSASDQCSPEGECVECTENTHCTTEAAPRCDTTSYSCESCIESTDCDAFATKPNCDTDSGACVQCTSNDHCTSTSASTCDANHLCQPCETDVDCEHLSDTTTCDNGECVQCTGTNYDACGGFSGTPYNGAPIVCDSLTKTCATNDPYHIEHILSDCGACLSDAHCKVGQLCVMQQYEGQDVGYFCVWEQGAGGNAPDDCLLEGRPFVEAIEHQISIDGVEATTCNLRVSTCFSYNQMARTACAPEGTPDDSLCGFEPGVDGKCRIHKIDYHVCTLSCGSDDDCPTNTYCAVDECYLE